MATIKTFAGGAIPDWALSSARQTTRDLNSIVSSITDAYLRQQRLKQQQEQFDEQMQFKKDNLEYNRNLAIQQQENLDAQRREQKRQFDENFKYRKDKDEYNFFTDGLDSVVEYSDLSSFDTKDTYLKTVRENPEYADNEFIQNKIDSELRTNTRMKADFTRVHKQVENMLYPNMDKEEIDEAGGTYIVNAITQKYIQDPQNFFGTSRSNQLTNGFLSNAMPGFNFTNDKNQKALIDGIGTITSTMLLYDENSQEYVKLNNVMKGMVDKLGKAYPVDELKFNSLVGNSKVLSDYAEKSDLSLEEVKSKIEDGTLGEDEILETLKDEPKDKKIVGPMNYSFLSDFSPETQEYLSEGVKDFVNSITGFFTPDDGAIVGPQELSFNGVRALTVPGSEKTDEAGNVSIELSFEDRPNERVAMSAIQDQLQPPISETQGGEERSFNDALMSTPAAQTVVSFLESFKDIPKLPEKAKNIYAKFAQENPNLAIGLKSVSKAAVNTFAPMLSPVASTLAFASSTPEERAKVADATLEQLNKAGDMAKDFAYLAIEKTEPVLQSIVETANDKFTQGVKAIGDARGPKLALLRGMQVLSTVPHRALEVFNFQRNPDIKKYIEQGMNPDDAIDQAYKDAVARGGTYFTTSFIRVGEDAPPEFLYKKQLVDYSKGWYKDGKLPENMAKAPSKFKNPRYIAWKTNELEKDIYQQFANITDSKTQNVATAGRTMSGVKTEARRIIKDLRKLKNDINKSPKIAKGISSVSPKVIDELINRAQRLTASKSAQAVWDEFMKGAEFDFDLQKEVDAQVDRAVRDLEFEDLIRQQSPNYSSTKEDAEYFELMGSLGRK